MSIEQRAQMYALLYLRAFADERADLMQEYVTPERAVYSRAFAALRDEFDARIAALRAEMERERAS